ncbi:MAG: hypothetical protein ACK559_28315, partial [bacterium]
MLDQLMENRRVEIAHGVAGSGDAAGERQRTATQRPGGEDRAIECMRHRHGLRQIGRGTPHRAGRDVEQAHRHAGVHCPHEIGLGRVRQPRVGEHLRHPQAPPVEHVEQ